MQGLTFFLATDAAEWWALADGADDDGEGDSRDCRGRHGTDGCGRLRRRQAVNCWKNGAGVGMTTSGGVRLFEICRLAVLKRLEGPWLKDTYEKGK